MQGTEKQVAWATDIINQPADLLQRYADELAASTLREHHAAAKSVEKAVAMYRDGLAKLPQLDDARFVIDKRSRFAAAAMEAVRRCLLADGIHPSNYLLALGQKYGW